MASIAVLAIGLPVALIAEIPDVGRSYAWSVTLLIMAWAGVRLSFLWVRGVASLFDFFFWLFVYIFMGLAPTAQLRSDLISTTTRGMNSDLDLPTALVVLGGILVYEVSRVGWRAIAREGKHHDEQPLVRVSLWRSVALAGAGLLFSAYFVSKVGLGAALGSREAAFNARTAAWPDPSMRAVFYALATYPSLVAVGALLQVQRKVAGLKRGLLITLIVVGLAALATIVSPISSARYTLGTVAFAVVVHLGAMKTTLRARWTMLGTLAGFLFLFPLADAFRTDNVQVTRTGFFDEYLSNPDYDSFWQVANALNFWLDSLVEPGRQLLGSLFFWVPRSIWPDKPIDTGSLLAQYRGYSFENLSAPLWAELLVNGGLIAVVVGFAVLGVALGAFDRRIAPAFRLAGWWAIVGAILPVYMTILLRGSLLQATGSVAVTLCCLLLVRRAPSSSEQPGPLRSLPSSGENERGRGLGGPVGRRRLDR